MEVYVITEHVEWEGFSIVGVWSTELAARNEVWSYVAGNLAYNIADGNNVKTTGFHETSAQSFRHKYPDRVHQWYRVTKHRVQDLPMPTRE